MFLDDEEVRAKIQKLISIYEDKITALRMKYDQIKDCSNRHWSVEALMAAKNDVNCEVAYVRRQMEHLRDQIGGRKESQVDVAPIIGGSYEVYVANENPRGARDYSGILGDPVPESSLNVVLDDTNCPIQNYIS